MNPPCKHQGQLCPRFVPGCREGCGAYRDWSERNQEEKAARDALRKAVREMDEFVAESISRRRRRR